MPPLARRAALAPDRDCEVGSISRRSAADGATEADRAGLRRGSWHVVEGPEPWLRAFAAGAVQDGGESLLLRRWPHG